MSARNTNETIIRRKLIRKTPLVKYEFVGISVDMTGHNERSMNPGWFAYKKSGFADTLSHGTTDLRIFYNQYLLKANFDKLKTEFAKYDNMVEFCVGNGFNGLITHPNHTQYSKEFIDATFVNQKQLRDFMNDMDCDYYFVIVSNNNHA